MVYHPASKSFRLNRGRTLKEDRFYAIVHEEPQSSSQNQSESCSAHQWQTTARYHSLGTESSSTSKSCQEIMDAMPISDCCGADMPEWPERKTCPCCRNNTQPMKVEPK